MSFWNSVWPHVLDALKSFRPDTAAAHALVPVVSATAKLRRKAKPRGRFPAVAALADIAAVLASAKLASALHDFAHGADGSINLHLKAALLLSLLFVAISAIRNDYTLA